MWFFDVFEEGGDIIVEGDLPGFAKDDVAIFADDSRLVLTGTRKSRLRSPGRTYYQRERRWTTVSREIPLPRPIHVEDGDATLRDGILRVRLRPSGHRGSGRFEVPLESY